MPLAARRLRPPRPGRWLPVAAAATALALSACSGGDEGSADAPSAGGSASSSVASSATESPSAPASSSPQPARPAPTPTRKACYRLSYRQALAPTSGRSPVPCRKPHTATTYAVGRLDTVVDGHLLAVDSDRVQAEVARACPTLFARFVGGDEEDRRLSMLRPVWFTPTVAQSEAGAEWYRCDVVALAGEQRLAPLDGPVAGALDSGAGRDRYGMCGTAQPGSRDFHRVICSRGHSWRAVRVVPLAGGNYPGARAVRAAGTEPCQDAGAAAAGGALDYAWGYEWPSAAQWRDGQHFGRCWVPD